MNKRGVVVDNNVDGDKEIGGMLVDVPLNRNLSLKLFGQLKTLLEKKTYQLEFEGSLTWSYSQESSQS